MKALIRVDVPEWQIGQEAHIIFRDTMEKHGVCEADTVVLCRDCKYFDVYYPEGLSARIFGDEPHYFCNNPRSSTEEYIPTKGAKWFCADGEVKQNDKRTG